MELWSDGFPRMSTVLPCLEHGEVQVEHLDEPEGRIAALYVGHRLWMSDTLTERADHLRALQEAHGHVLVAGLGLGMFPLAAALKPEVERVTVVEIDPDTTQAILPHLLQHAKNIEVVQADIFQFQPPMFDFGWLDIWEDIHMDNLVEMTRLRHRLLRHTLDQDPVRIQCWGEQKLLDREHTPDSPDLRYRRAPYYYLVKRITTSGFDCEVLDPDVLSEEVYWSENPNHGVCTVRPGRGESWKLQVLEDGEVASQR